MKILFVLVAALTIAKTDAATAYLQHCEPVKSPTGFIQYVGTYKYSGREYLFTFDSWCPATVELR